MLSRKLTLQCACLQVCPSFCFGVGVRIVPTSVQKRDHGIMHTATLVEIIKEESVMKKFIHGLMLQGSLSQLLV